MQILDLGDLVRKVRGEVGLGDDLLVQGGDLVREARGFSGFFFDFRLQGGDLVRLLFRFLFPLVN